MDTQHLTKAVTIDPANRASFVNNTFRCIGTGRMGLALQQEYQEQMRLVMKHFPFEYIRGHGLFSDDMGIYQCVEDESGKHVSYNFTYLDRVMDFYREVSLRPFLELGFMPEKLASGTQTVFYWKGQVTPPKDDDGWCDLVEATLRHCIRRYGLEEVLKWPIEVWNEPNLTGFWENADKPKYLHLYEITARRIKSIDARFQVGGPAICGGDGSLQWVRDFLTFCEENDVPVDFVSRHAYMGQATEKHGRYTYHTMCEVDYTVDEMSQTREIIRSFPRYRDLPMHVTEFNTSYNPMCPIHDTKLNAALIAGLLGKLGNCCDSYSYWTFGDVFEEMGVPALPFHGGFGLVANQQIPKPTFWAFNFFSRLTGECVYHDDHLIVMRREDGSYNGIAWNESRDTRRTVDLSVAIPADSKEYCFIRSLLPDPAAMWHNMGEPASLSSEQLELLRSAAQVSFTSRKLQAKDGKVLLPIAMEENDVVYFTLTEVQPEGDYGFDYQWYMQHPEKAAK